MKATRQFLEDQAVEREQERDEFSKEIEKLRVIVKDKDKEKAAQDSLAKEVRICYIVTLHVDRTIFLSCSIDFISVIFAIFLFLHNSKLSC